eukprot:3393318-Prymnesium_polylepis.1
MEAAWYRGELSRRVSRVASKGWSTVTLPERSPHTILVSYDEKPTLVTSSPTSSLSCASHTLSPLAASNTVNLPEPSQDQHMILVLSDEKRMLFTPP